MEAHPGLYALAKLLLAEDNPERTAELLLRRLLTETEAERGFIVVRHGDDYEQKLDVSFDRKTVPAEKRRFSRSLVQRAIETQELIHSPNLPEDPRFADAESLRWLGRFAILVVPLRHAGQVYGVLYLERASSAEGFSADALRFAHEFAEMAALCLRKALECQALRERNRSLERSLLARHDFAGIVTQHPQMLELLRTVAQVAASEATVLLTGESGTGKELVAQALHWNSSRAARPFVALHCAALPATVLESELFGHVRGAFTGAERERKGRLASADGGTLLLDEVAEIPVEVQAKLLRFLQFGEIQRVGSDRTETVDVRVVSATLSDLPALVKAGRFRQDLYFRLKVIELRVPPLRERKSDIPLLAAHFLRSHWRRSKEPGRFSPAAEQILGSYHWPGNVRELDHVVQRACVLTTGPVLDTDLLPPEIVASDDWQSFTELDKAELQAAREAAVDQVERRRLAALLERHAGNVSRAARHAGLQRASLQKLLAKHRGALSGRGGSASG